MKAQRRNMRRGMLTRYWVGVRGASAYPSATPAQGGARRAHRALTSWKKAEARNTPVLATHLLLPLRSMGL